MKVEYKLLMDRNIIKNICFGVKCEKYYNN